MCKVAAVAGVTDQNRDDVWLFMMAISEFISRDNNQGLGYASVDSQGRVFGERWVRNGMAFRDDPRTRYTNKLYSSFGPVNPKDAQAIILHARAATVGSTSIENTHPFCDDEANPQVAIIHNGYFNNHHTHVKKTSSCDSEILAHLYASHGVTADITKSADLYKDLEGWYTALVMTPTHVDILVDAHPRLSSFYIPEIEARVYSSEYRDIERTCRALNLNWQECVIEQPNTVKRLDTMTGNTVEEFIADNTAARFFLHRGE